ncbi:hypothetical protein LINPERPRIM_LOCUS8899 [Linum perenne]
MHPPTLPAACIAPLISLPLFSTTTIAALQHHHRRTSNTTAAAHPTPPPPPHLLHQSLRSAGEGWTPISNPSSPIRHSFSDPTPHLHQPHHSSDLLNHRRLISSSSPSASFVAVVVELGIGERGFGGRGLGGVGSGERTSDLEKGRRIEDRSDGAAGGIWR